VTVDVVKLRQSRRYKEWAAAQRRRLGDQCALCGHRGAGDLDHIVPVAVDPSRVMDPSNVQMAHGVDGCPFCEPIVTRNGTKRLACNQSKGAGEARMPLVQVRADGCGVCRGVVCSNGVRRGDGMLSRCW
jgi:hypothetical protein